MKFISFIHLLLFQRHTQPWGQGENVQTFVNNQLSECEASSAESPKGEAMETVSPGGGSFLSGARIRVLG